MLAFELHHFRCSPCSAYTATDSAAKKYQFNKGYAYFLFVKNRIKVSEVSLPSLIVQWPIDKKLTDALFHKLLYYFYTKTYSKSSS